MSKFTVMTEGDIHIETDGVEIEGDGKYSFSVMPHAINMVVNRK